MLSADVLVVGLELDLVAYKDSGAGTNIIMWARVQNKAPEKIFCHAPRQ